MATEAEILEFWRQILPKQPTPEPAAVLSERECRECCRLDLGFGHTGIRVTATLCVNLDRTALTVVVIHPRSYDSPLMHQWKLLEKGWRRRSGTRKVPMDVATTFLTRLTELGAWTLPDGPVGGRGGLSGYHVVASAGREHCFKFNQPYHYDNQAYVQIIALYFDTFFDGYCKEELRDPRQR